MTTPYKTTSGAVRLSERKMAALGQLSRTLLRSAVAQGRRNFSAAAAGHGEQAGKSGGRRVLLPGERRVCGRGVFLSYQ